MEPRSSRRSRYVNLPSHVPPGLQLSSIRSGRGRSGLATQSATASTPQIRHSSTCQIGRLKNRLQISFDAWQPLVMGDAPGVCRAFERKGCFGVPPRFELAIAATHELKHLDLTDCIETERQPTPTPVTNRLKVITSQHTRRRRRWKSICRNTKPDTTSPGWNVVRSGRSESQRPSRNSIESCSAAATHKLVGSVAPGWIVGAWKQFPPMRCPNGSSTDAEKNSTSKSNCLPRKCCSEHDGNCHGTAAAI